ncbi:MAG: hypothetical protein II727_04145 [Oscillospiraceae bacterium]|nr:hypothetical protein [Oscillospiraceae bacterium]
MAYLKGLLEGLELDENAKETKLFKAIIDTLAQIASDLEDAEDDIIDMGDQIDDIVDEITDLEDDFDDVVDDLYEDDEDDEDEYEYDDEDEDDDFFEINCPNCDNSLYVDSSILEDGSIECPECGTVIEFNSDSDEDDDE